MIEPIIIAPDGSALDLSKIVMIKPLKNYKLEYINNIIEFKIDVIFYLGLNKPFTTTLILDDLKLDLPFDEKRIKSKEIYQERWNSFVLQWQTYKRSRMIANEKER